MGKIEEFNEPKTCSQALIHPAWDDLLSLLGLYGIETMDRVGLIDTSYDEADIRWNYIVDNTYVLRLTNAPEMTEERLADLNRLIGRYGEFGLRCPAFIRGTDGLFFHSWGALTAYLSEYVDLPTADKAGLSQEEKDALREEVVLSIARFMERYKGVDLSPTMGMYSLFDLCPYDVPLGMDEKQQNFNDLCAALCKAGEEGLAQRLTAKNEAVRAQLLSVYRDLPRCVTQADEGFTNVLLDGEKHLAGLIDFNLSGTDVCVNLIANNAILDALELYHPNIPIVWNTGGYETVETLKRLEGAVNIYLPDLKHVSPRLAKLCAGAPDYFEVASAALLELCRQTGEPVYDAEGMMQKGVIVRHLILPGCTGDSIRALDFIAEHLPKDTPVSLMRQYTPEPWCTIPGLDRRVTDAEYERVLTHFEMLGLPGYTQEKEAADGAFTPNFDGTGV